MDSENLKTIGKVIAKLEKIQGNKFTPSKFNNLTNHPGLYLGKLIAQMNAPKEITDLMASITELPNNINAEQLSQLMLGYYQK